MYLALIPILKVSYTFVIRGCNALRVLIAASGGGHTGYAVALAQFLVEFSVEPDFVVPVGGVE